jgi:choline dehydrogenase-like flavoprotein
MSDAQRWAAHAALIDALARTVVPADEAPDAADAGAADFLRAELFGDRAAERPAILDALDRLAASGFAEGDPLPPGDPALTRLAALIAYGYWADPGNGGNRGGASWAALGYAPEPPGGWVVADVEQRPATVTPDRVADRYDAVVIGSGAGGGTAAAVLAESGRRVLLVERGDWPDALALWRDHLHNPRVDLGFDPLTGPPSAGNDRILDVDGTAAVVGPADARWGNNAMTAGGGTRVYGAQAWRFAPDDFRMASRYGVPDGSALADWPISYDDLEPWYDRAERELGVSGSDRGDTVAGPRSRPYPMPPLPPTTAAAVLARGARRLGLSTLPVPLLVNSVPYGGRSACLRCGACVGFACPAGAKAGSHNTMIRRALATGRCDLLTGATVTRIVVDGRGRAAAVEIATAPGVRRRVAAAEFVVAAGAIESARLLLASAHPGEPDGLGNGTGQVGRHLQGHLYAGALAVFGEPVVDGAGPGPSIATCDYRHGNAGLVGGGMLANEFVLTPAGAYRHLTDAGLIPRTGAESKRLLRAYWPGLERIVGPVQEVTSAESRVTLDPGRSDALGRPLVRLSGSVHPEDRRVQAFLADRAADWLRAAGAVQVVRTEPRPPGAGPSSGQHQAGTLRMGADPATSATDPEGRVWGHANVRVADASTHVTNGGVNPVLTIFANALRISTSMAA